MIKTVDELKQQLAAIEHERWAEWQKYCHEVLRENNPSPEQGDILERWDKQIATPYAELSAKEKASDMEQVDRYWSLIEALIQSELNNAQLQLQTAVLAAAPKDRTAILSADGQAIAKSYMDGFNMCRALYIVALQQLFESEQL